MTYTLIEAVDVPVRSTLESIFRSLSGTFVNFTVMNKHCYCRFAFLSYCEKKVSISNERHL